MEKKLNTHIERFITKYKGDLKEKVVSLEFENKTKVNELLEFVYDYGRLVLTKDDFVKRKRVKNDIPCQNRCNAKRANGEQCTRRRKKECEFCGTHSKGTPHGLVQNDIVESQYNKKVEVFVQDIKGIIYYIDKNKNVYKTQDILEDKDNPQIIGKYEIANGVYTIPEFGLV